MFLFVIFLQLGFVKVLDRFRCPFWSPFCRFFGKKTKKGSFQNSTNNKTVFSRFWPRFCEPPTLQNRAPVYTKTLFSRIAPDGQKTPKMCKNDPNGLPKMSQKVTRGLQNTFSKSMQKNMQTKHKNNTPKRITLGSRGSTKSDVFCTILLDLVFLTPGGHFLITFWHRCGSLFDDFLPHVGQHFGNFFYNLKRGQGRARSARPQTDHSADALHSRLQPNCCHIMGNISDAFCKFVCVCFAISMPMWFFLLLVSAFAGRFFLFFALPVHFARLFFF